MRGRKGSNGHGVDPGIAPSSFVHDDVGIFSVKLITPGQDVFSRQQQYGNLFPFSDVSRDSIEGPYGLLFVDGEVNGVDGELDRGVYGKGEKSSGKGRGVQRRRRRRRSGGAGIAEGARLANGSPERGAGGEVAVGVGGVGGAEGGGRGGEGGGGVLVGVVAVGHGLFAGYCVGGLSAVLRALVDGMETSGCTFTHGPVMMGDDGRRWTMTIDR
mmetsp:Transcript_6868/g.14711  ORF Transcript_6868/g.14711 Transcript_6868/m.14711 type:complete len:214 (+) Transcript_6868:2012-2653(+)